MIKDKCLRRMFVHELNHCRELFPDNENVVNESEIMQHGDAAIKILAQAIVAILDPLKDLPNPDRFRVLGETGDSIRDIRFRQVKPADDPENETVSIRVIEQKRILDLVCPRLYRDDTLDRKSVV